MKAMIFAAGMGTRLLPLTKDKPKALVELQGKTLLRILLEKLKKNKISELIINIHHYSDQIIKYLNDHDNFGMDIEISDESDFLLDTGGGIKKASWFFDDAKPFLIHNVDIICNLSLQEMYESHMHSGALATLAVKTRQTSRYLLFNDQQRLCGWEHVKTKEKIVVNTDESLSPYAFSGIHIVDPRIFSMITEKGKFSIVDTYLRLAQTQTIKAFLHNNKDWMDVGKPLDLKRAEGMSNLLEL
jgi:NDP-sugar pyrophosphorylase family protein